MNTERRIIMRIELSPSAKEKLTEVSDRTGMTQVAITSRLTEWLCRQPPEIQRAILIEYANGEQDSATLSKMILKLMSNR